MRLIFVIYLLQLLPERVEVDIFFYDVIKRRYFFFICNNTFR